MGNHPFTMRFRRNRFKPGSVIVITGASSGMGKEFAFRYAMRDCKIVIGSRNIEKLEIIAESCMKQNPESKVIPIQCDVTKEEDC